jgi:nucleoside-triphosphatase THEP1
MNEQRKSHFLLNNIEFRNVIDLVNNTNLSIFLSGKAGSGKTTLIHNLESLTYKNFLVVAPTGVAAVNAKGVTIHNLFQLPVGNIYTPGSLTLKNARLSSEKRKLILGIDLLVVDEVSMVRADVLDSVDQVLKNVRNSERPFGGLQMLFVGDLYQLPPVCTQAEWKVLSKFYKSLFVIDARSFSNARPVTIELQHIYRQSDNDFIKLLNDLRSNSIAQRGLNIINQRVVTNASGLKVVTLTTHNALADQINSSTLDQLEGDLIELRAIIDGDFDTTSVIADATLQLKVGAPVMLIRNYHHDDVLHHNGKIGVVEVVHSDTLIVRFDDQVVPIRKAIWQSFDYSFDDSKQVTRAQVTGSFEQFPVRLGWAITIHKSQGLTFDVAKIDVENAFSAGQVYVALSRVRSMEGLMLSAPLTAQKVKVDSRISEFFSSDPNWYELLSEKIIADSKIQYLETLLMKWFDLKDLCEGFYQPGANTKTTELVETMGKLDNHAKRFMKEVSSILISGESDQFVTLQTRLSAAVIYFENQLASLSTEVRELITLYEGDIIYKKVIIFLKALRKAIEQKRNHLKVAKRLGNQISNTQDLGILLKFGEYI